MKLRAQIKSHKVYENFDKFNDSNQSYQINAIFNMCDNNKCVTNDDYIMFIKFIIFDIEQNQYYDSKYNFKRNCSTIKLIEKYTLLELSSTLATTVPIIVSTLLKTTNVKDELTMGASITKNTKTPLTIPTLPPPTITPFTIQISLTSITPTNESTTKPPTTFKSSSHNMIKELIIFNKCIKLNYIFCNPIGANIDHTQDQFFNDHFIIIQSVINDYSIIYKINAIYNIVDDTLIVCYHLFSCNFSTKQQINDQQLNKNKQYFINTITKSFHKMNDKMKSIDITVMLNKNENNESLIDNHKNDNNNTNDNKNKLLNNASINRMHSYQKSKKIDCINDKKNLLTSNGYYLLKKIIYYLMILNCILFTIDINKTYVNAFDINNNNHTIRANDHTETKLSLPLIITNRTDADVLPLNYKNRKIARSSGGTETIMDIQNLKHYISNSGAIQHHHQNGQHQQQHSAHHYTDGLKHHQKSQYTSDSSVHVDDSFDHLTSNDSDDSSNEYNGCASCQLREQLKAQNLESIRMNILARLSMSQPPNITTRPQISEHLIQSFYSQNGVRYIRVNSNNQNDNDSDMSEMQGDDPMVSDSTISHHFHYKHRNDDQTINQMQHHHHPHQHQHHREHHHREHQSQSIGKKSNRRKNGESIEAISHKYHPDNEYEFDYGDPGHIYNTDFYDDADEFEEEAEEGFYSITDSIYSFPKCK